MPNNQTPEQQNNTPEQKIPWHHARWFWGVVIGVYLIPIIILKLKIIQLKQNVLFALPRGFTETIYAICNIQATGILPNFYKYNPSVGYKTYLYIFSLIFYIILFFLIYKIFQQKKIKIKLAIPVVIILSLSIFGLGAYFFLSSFM